MVDEIDEKIIEILKENARTTYVDIGKALNLSEGTVRNRIQALTDSKVIKRFTIDVSLTVGVKALTMVSVDPQIPTNQISDNILTLSGVETIYEVTGEYDIVTVVSSPSIEELNHTIEDIRIIKGVVKTNTIIVLRTI
jgi:Lrp/AsnC family transcriptional regulator of lysine biosynthesis